MAENKPQDWIKVLENFYKQLPKIPKSGRDVLVKIAPALSLAFGILGILVGLGALGLSPAAMLNGLHSSFIVFLTGAITIASSVLMLMAYPKLAKHQYRGWELLFWSDAITVIYGILTFSIGSLLSVFIGFYLLFQIKEYYK